MAAITTSFSIIFSRATASAIWRSSARLALIPVTDIRLFLFFCVVLVFVVGGLGGLGLQPLGALLGALLHQLVGEHELGVGDPGERHERRLFFAFEIDG